MRAMGANSVEGSSVEGYGEVPVIVVVSNVRDWWIQEETICLRHGRRKQAQKL